MASHPYRLALDIILFFSNSINSIGAPVCSMIATLIPLVIPENVESLGQKAKIGIILHDIPTDADPFGK